MLALARLLAAWPADVLFRLSSLEPMDCSPELVDLVAASPRLAPHFHLPLQHASDEMLAAMRRPYSLDVLPRRWSSAIRARMPHASIGSDVDRRISRRDRRARLGAASTYLEASPLTHVHVFPYSHRPGTEASALDGMPAPPVVQQRARGGARASERLSRAFRAAQVGTVRRALVVDDGTAAVTDNYLRLALDRAVHPQRVDRRRGRGRDDAAVVLTEAAAK